MTARQIWIVKRYCYPFRSLEAGKWEKPLEWPWENWHGRFDTE